MGDAQYGSDLIVDVLRALGIEYAALNPGATFRGLHDSLVNYGGNERPGIIQCCHEEIAVAVAHGYAKAAGKPMAAIVHDVVGLQHASMAIFNAWCDRVPILVLGGTGPMAIEKRRPWIDWIHTALVQGQAVRDYVKWDDQPASLASIPEALIRGYRIATTEPQGPVYVCFDAELQEMPLSEKIPLPDVARHAPPSPVQADARALDAAASLLREAERPVIIAESVGRTAAAVDALVRLAERLAAPVIDLYGHGRFNFPNTHPLDLTGAEKELLQAMGLECDFPDTGCCGMAGSFGFEDGAHYDVSIKCGERVLLPAVRNASKETLIIADGFSCREQIAQATDRHALHLAQVVQMALRENGS